MKDLFFLSLEKLGKCVSYEIHGFKLYLVTSAGADRRMTIHAINTDMAV